MSRSHRNRRLFVHSMTTKTPHSLHWKKAKASCNAHFNTYRLLNVFSGGVFSFRSASNDQKKIFIRGNQPHFDPISNIRTIRKMLPWYCINMNEHQLSIPFIISNFDGLCYGWWGQKVFRERSSFGTFVCFAFYYLLNAQNRELRSEQTQSM